MGSLVTASALISGCGGSSDDGFDIQANWSFHHADDSASAPSLGCPTGYDTAAVYAQPVDDNLADNGSPIVDLYDCQAYTGTNSYPDDLYLTWVEIQTDAGGLYAQSASALVDTGTGDHSFDADIIDDGGYFYLTWSLVDTGGAPLSCAQAGVTSAGSVEVISTDVSDATYSFDDKFTCEDHYGVTSPLLAGDYTVSIDAEDGSGALGEPVNKTATIHAPNGLTPLGHVVLTIDDI